jgi:UDP-N-acetyl-2-amino-2-deoxyglucuronate dehydrogenase
VKFALIGVGGYIAPRHLKAIKDTGNELVAAMDVHDSVGILDRYFPRVDFFTEFERFERHLEKLRRLNKGVDYLVVCTPNYLHDSHIRCGIRVGADVICEKPIVVKPHNYDAICELADHWNRKVYTTTQMRLHHETERMKENIPAGIRGNWVNVEIDYVAPRGKWYDYSWKADENKSGGLIYNIGIHLLDLMCFLFGEPFKDHKAEYVSDHAIKGEVYLEGAKVSFNLATSGSSRRQITMDGTAYDFSKGFEDLHTRCYESVLNGEDLFDIKTARTAIYLADTLRTTARDSLHCHC